MQFDLVKHPGGVFALADDIDLPRINRFKTGVTYTAEIKLTRNPLFHKKMFAFFAFCFEYWAADKAGYECSDEYTQKEEFRKNLTILAGFSDVVTTIKGEVRVRAKSLSYANMKADEFERCYRSMINAAIKHVFANTKDHSILNRLQAFF
ncbi:DUF1367 family protein [Rosenbergiella nectarea]|uniref:DUF1367 family protein n=1 Tax=Rosenbergiella nectarea TaxID=988801 RepID=UPI001F4F069C|nr:DUF1367 family protein [Rosenbergiella nectarea]